MKRETQKIQRIAIDDNYQLEIRTPNCASITCNVGKYNIAVRGIKEYPDLSEETIAFSGSLYINGRKAGMTRNSGFGGANDINWSNIALRDDFIHYFNSKRIRLDSIISTLVASNIDMRASKELCRKNGVNFSFGGFILDYKKSNGFPKI